MRRTFALAVLLVLGVAAGRAAAAIPAVTAKEIEEGLTCQCGCGLTVHSCNHLQCGSGIPLKQEVAALISEGLGRDEILVRFRDKYGEKILSSPTAEGFNLAAWIVPFAAVAGGALLLIATVRRWSVPPPPADEAASVAASPSPAERERLEDELRRGS